MNSDGFFNTDFVNFFNDSTYSKSWAVYKLTSKTPFTKSRHKPQSASKHASGASTNTFFLIPNSAFY